MCLMKRMVPLYDDCEFCRKGVIHDKVNDKVVTPENIDAKINAAMEKAVNDAVDKIAECLDSYPFDKEFD